MIIDASNFDEAVAGELERREPKAPAAIPADLDKAWNALSEEEQRSYRRSAEVRWPFEVPAKLPGETKATWHLRAEQSEIDRQKVLDSAQLEAYKRSQTPSKLQNLVTTMGQGLREESAARRRDAAAKAEEQELLLDAQRKRAGREGGSGLGGGCRQV